MNLLWWAFIIVLGLGLAASAITLVLGVAYFLIFSIVEYIESKLGTITIGEEEEELILRAEELREKQIQAFEGPWTLQAQVKPYSSKALRLTRAKEILGKG